MLLATLGLAAMPPDPASAAPASAEQRWTGVRGTPMPPAPERKPNFGERWVAPPVSWPGAGTATVDLAAGPAAGRSSAASAAVDAGELPVRVAKATPDGPSGLRLTLTDRATARRTGVDGLLLRATPTTDPGTSGRVRVWVDPAGIVGEYGGDWAQRLRLVALPACAASTPEVPACRVQTPLPTRSEDGRLTAEVTLPATRSGPRADRTAPQHREAVFAVTAGAAGNSGDYSATPLKPSGSWTAGGHSGDFGYSYPVDLPPVPGDLSPQVELSYSAQSIDGKQVSTNNQSSAIGDGWDYSPGAVERTYRTCADDSAAPKVNDSCWAGPIVSVSFGAGAGDLVYDATVPTKWRLSSDNGVKVELLPGADNGSHDGEHWKITTQDGTQYWFGKNKLPGHSGNNPTTNSAWTQRVYHPRSTDPCYKSSGFANSHCEMAYKWNLDYIVDPHKNAIAYYYGTETGYYGPNKSFTPVKYVRGGYLDHIDYGLRDPNPYAGRAPGRVQFSYAERCVESDTVCAPANIDKDKAKWPDTPYDLNCKSTGDCYMHSVTFWSRLRLTAIATQVNNGTAHTTVDTHKLSHTFPAPGDGTSPALWLTSIQHTAGTGADAVTLPAVTFEPTKLPNRADGIDGAPAMNHNRISTITTETGEVVGIGYRTECTAPVTLAPESNTKLCYPVYWTKEGEDKQTLDWFHKYVVDEVTDQDPTGGSTPVYTKYDYLDGGAWAYDDSEIVKDKHRTYGQWRGFGRVQVRTGAGVDQKTLTETVYYRGLDGDRLPNNARRSAKVKLSTAVTVPGATAEVPDQPQLAGSIRQVLRFESDGGPVHDTTVTDYWVSPATATRKRSVGDLTAHMARPASTKTTTAITSTNPTSYRTTRTDTTYSTSTGLPTVVHDYGDVSQPSQATCSVTTYAPTNTTAYIVDQAAQTELFALPCGGSGINGQTAPASVNRPADVISSTRAFFDTKTYATTWPQPAPSIGNVNVVQHYTEDGHVVVAKTQYDDYGRPVESFDANGNKTSTTYTMTNGLTTSVLSTNPRKHETLTTLEPTRGLEIEEVDENDLKTTQRYDALGRLVGVWFPGRSLSQGANEKYDYTVSNSVPSTITTSNLNDDGTYRVEVEFFDALARPRQKQSSTPVGGRLLSDSFYDSRGWLRTANNDYHDSASTPNTEMLDMRGKDQQILNQDLITYDGVGRKTLIVSRSKGQTKWQTRSIFGGDRTTTIPPDGGTPTTEVVDGRGRVVERLSYQSMPSVSGSVVSGGNPVKISYRFDRRGNPDRVTDDDNNSWTTTYDLRGRAVQREDPDAGTSELSYDANGNVTSTRDPLGRTVTTSYDELDRRTGEYEGPSTTAPPRAIWTYDSTTITNGIGEVASETSYDNGKAYVSAPSGYNVWGEEVGVNVTIPSDPANGSLAGTYTFTREFTTTNGLLKKSLFPAGGGLPAETVNHTYTALDLPSGVGSSLGNYVDSTRYNAFGQVSQSKFGFGTTNTAWTSYVYDEHSKRLRNTYVDRNGTGTSRMNDVVYEHNAAGKVVKVVDARNAGAQRETQCFRYDLLGRLGTAWTANDDCRVDLSAGGSNATVGGITPYWTSWTYNDVGDRTREVQHALPGESGDTTTNYKYPTGGAQPHAVRSEEVSGPAGTSTRTFQYDILGNNTGRGTPDRGNQTLDWNTDGRLTKVRTGATTDATYVYDADGELLLQRNLKEKNATLYLPGQELTLDTASGTVSGRRYYTGADGTTCVRSGTAAGAYSYLVNDRLGTATLTLDNNGTNPKWRAFTPYGAPRGSAPANWPNKRGYLGKPTDEVTGLTVLGARHYDPAAGRFVSVDPILNTEDPNQIGGYTYAGDDPVNRSDPGGTNAYDSQTPCARYNCGYGNYDRSETASPNKTNTAANGWPGTKYYHSNGAPKQRSKNKGGGNNGGNKSAPPKKKKKCNFLCKAKGGWDASVRWAKRNPDLVGVIAGVAVGLTCTAVTMGTATLACGALGGAVGSGMTSYLKGDSLGKVALNTGLGAVMGAIGAGTTSILGEVAKRAIVKTAAKAGVTRIFSKGWQTAGRGKLLPSGRTMLHELKTAVSPSHYKRAFTARKEMRSMAKKFGMKPSSLTRGVLKTDGWAMGVGGVVGGYLPASISDFSKLGQFNPWGGLGGAAPGIRS
ncbi:RHS repeat-associated core domain-containing protein [Micromonospora sp. WMMD1102]|uniref:RHS repeat domain-containing protein n=1 Tax=Micromonospora sp. WMMD1102 TaxID=3016105 RepID=UPI0024155438|nr:RHS repeat-associated core domain-containing protein [Micromonospora sp. WMMD1102]MDG4785251.1 RHS repeat-associated core domain-containing protein [Micromonospora sp. WMMD1102]